MKYLKKLSTKILEYNLYMPDGETLGIWDPSKFQKERFPIRVGEISNKTEFSKPKISVLDMLIKLPKGEFKIPSKDKSIQEVIDRAVQYEKTINPNWENYYVYLTVHYTPQVKKGNSQRRGGAHFDGMQGQNYKEKIPICHSYVIADAVPTVFHTNPFDARDLDDKHDNWFKKMDKQVDPSKDFTVKPYNIYFMSAYHLHSSVPAIEDTSRVFMRVEFSLKQFNREDNTKNPMINVNWDWKEREIPSNLRENKD